ncbi:hypothetical protein Q6D67_12485 [Haliea sp. E1-2-M8]|uniref:hypothetical protein n=1 Tax=Haliea sp. E1-2-M8 TaxID=3064706 RepID=UPI00271E1D68|nr:hypothetical protein [Haliea sp. E1-2-M8]MDO8862520.1 hypothetical protein [Haliea sp. E1-2-M8]
MKKNIISAAVAATLLGASAANAVFVNTEGHGQALIYPYYTVEGGHDTYINLVNTTNDTKAVKVRFVEAMNSQEVLDFNLYLSPQDHWSAVIFADGSGASIRTADTSCTVPNGLAATTEGVPGPVVEFRDLAYAADSAPFNGLDRTREGYVEIIEMGVLTDAGDVTAATHVAGVPPGCAALSANWAGSGKWNANGNTDIDVPTGGLYGYGVLINVNEGTNATYDAVALDDFVSSLDTGAIPIHFAPNTVDPGMVDATPIAQVLDSSANLTVVQSSFGSGIDAVSAVLMHSAIMNDYVLEPSIAAGTDWVITFPTKKNYVNGATPVAPFTNVWDSDFGTACEAMAITYYDREERTITPDPLDFSPAPVDETFALCREANVLTFNDSNVLAGSTRVNQNLDVDYNNGWLELGFTGPAARVLTSDEGHTYEGLPTVGFAVQKYVNGTLPGGVLSNYAGVVQHKNRRLVTAS